MVKQLKSLIFIAVAALAVAAQDRATITIAPEVTVESEVVRLGSIARFDGDRSFTERLGKVSLGYAPNIGAFREIRRERIAMAIAAAGFQAGQVTLDAPAAVTIKRTGQNVSAEIVRETVEKELAARFAADGIEIRNLKISFPADALVPLGNVEVRTNFASLQNPFQSFSISVEIRVEGKTFRRFPANVELEAFAAVYVAANELVLGQKLTESDLKLEKRRIEKPLANYLRGDSTLQGLTTVRRIDAGNPITTDSFVSAVVVRNGDPVKVEARSGKLNIIIAGEARASGRIGDRIAVKNLQSGAIIQATVTSEGVVAVRF